MFKKHGERKSHFLILAFLTGLFIGINFSFIATANEPAHKYLDYFHRVYQLIKSEYVDVPENKDVFYGAIKGMIKSLNDPFSRFLDEKSFSDLKEMTTGKFVGVGIVITVRDGEVTVISPIDDSPAMDAGIKAGDIIMKVNGKPIKDKKLNAVVKLIKGLPKTKVNLSVKREGFDKEMNFDIERAPIKIKSVEYSVIKDKNVGYIKIKNFGSDTTKDVTEALSAFKKKGIDKLIIDLRYNPGGLLQASVFVSDLFLEKGLTIVSTKGREGSRRQQVYKSLNDPVYTGKLLILVNKGSASASEIVSGAIMDNKRGKLLGEKTFGKGSVQKTYNLDKNVGVAITIAKYYTPSGRLIHKKGIMPDFKVPVTKFSKSDREAVQTLNNKKLIDKFIKRKMVYNSDSRKKFAEFLKKNNITLSERSTNFMLKSRLNRYKKQTIYDLEFDNQLLSGIKKIDEIQ